MSLAMSRKQRDRHTNLPWISKALAIFDDIIRSNSKSFFVFQ